MVQIGRTGSAAPGPLPVTLAVPVHWQLPLPLTGNSSTNFKLNGLPVCPNFKLKLRRTLPVWRLPVNLKRRRKFAEFKPPFYSQTFNAGVRHLTLLLCVCVSI